jgi:DNA-binding GntR family transcriptional regulator
MAPKGSKPSPVKRDTSLATLAEQAYQLIRQQVLHGELEPGTIVSERMLANRTQFGKAPIRTAVQRLASEGFISVEPRRGIVISPQSIQGVIDLYEIRLVLEQLVVRQIAGRLTAKQVERVRANLKEHQAVAKQSVPTKTLAVDFDFHRLLCDFYGNRPLVGILNRIYDSLFPELRLSHERTPGRVREAVYEHQAVAEAVIRGDVDEAERLMARHLTSCQEFVMHRGVRNGDGSRKGST